MDTSVPGVVSLVDWRWAMSELYGAIRAERDPARAWEMWCVRRHDLSTGHSQSPIREADRARNSGPHLHPYLPEARVLASLEPLTGDVVEIGTSDGRSTRMLRFGRAQFELFDQVASLDVFWLDQYGGGLYLAFREATSGGVTYGGGRYVLDTVKGTDLGTDRDRLVLDFNFAYQPSCSYDPSWSCPLPPPENVLPLAVPAGERLG